MKQIYLDSDDEITAIISKLESLESETVALIPPKRSTTLQSVVNLKLLKKAAEASDVKLVLITRDGGILNVASKLKILTSPNLETEPTVPEPSTPLKELPSTTIDGSLPSESDLSSADSAAAKIKQPKEGTATSKKLAQKNKRVPDFDRFKKWALLGIAGVILLGAGIWAFFNLLPGAEISIRGRTQATDIDFTMTLDAEAEESDIEAAVLAAESRQVGRTLTTTFEATGEDTVGERATGQVTVTNCESPAPASITIQEGTTLTAANGNRYLATTTTIVPGSTAGNQFVCAEDGRASVPVRAVDIGEAYNIGPTSYTVEGYSANTVYGQGGNMTGGSEETVTVVSQTDITSARAKLLEAEEDEVREELRRQFEEEHYVVEASFQADVSSTSSEPEVGEEAQNARLILQVTYTMLGVAREDFAALLESQHLLAVDESEGLGAIETGIDEAVTIATERARVFEVEAQGIVGPDIEVGEMAEAIAGMKYQEAIDHIEAIPNVTQVQIDLAPLWASTLPQNPERISIEFDIDGLDANDSSD